MSDPTTSSSGLTRRSFVQTAPPDGSAPALTCFSHRKKGNRVYQKREPTAIGTCSSTPR